MITTMIPIWVMAIAFVLCLILIGKTDKKSILKIIIVFLLLFLVSLRIKTNESPTERLENNLDVLFVIDNSISMVAEDYNGETPRIEGVKKDCENLIKEFSGAKFGLILFNDTGRIYCPFTKDIAMVKDAIQNIAIPERRYASGSSINSAIQPIVELFQNYQDEDRQKILVFISDGEITNGESLQSFAPIQTYIDNGIVLGYGSVQGGKMKVKDGMFGQAEASYLKDSTGSKTVDAVSVIDEPNLRKIANDLGVSYEHRERESSLSSFVQGVQESAKYTATGEQSESYQDTYYWFAIFLLGYLWIRLIILKRKG